jgi:hypothetical protein
MNVEMVERVTVDAAALSAIRKNTVLRRNQSPPASFDSLSVFKRGPSWTIRTKRPSSVTWSR